ncbi:MAG: hypothetical protein G01um101424_222 [Parcubacteria group bacterium Gr01-1014_24]|nr:MAG: hypothetical protein G01um101424_222 [Parcubacteria group bacterium Gr01-1014_24]
MFSPVAILTAIFAVFILLSVVVYTVVYAAVSETTAPAGVVTPSQTIKASSTDTPLIRFQLTGNNADNTITQVVVSIESTAGPTVTGDFTNLKVFKSADNILDGGDTVKGTQTTVNVGSTTTITVTGETIGAAASWYIVTASTAAGAVNGHAFKATMAANAITAGGTGGAALGTALLAAAVQALTIDTVVPTVSASCTGPANLSTGVPISTFVHVCFSENIDQSTITPSNVTFTSGGTPVGAGIRPFPDGFDVVVSNTPTFADSSRFAKLGSTSTAFYPIAGTNPISPQPPTGYASPTVGDIVIKQHETFPSDVGLITDATLTSGTFAFNGFPLHGSSQVTKVATPTATGAVTAATSVTAGDIIVVNTTTNPTDVKYNWHIVTTGAAVNNTSLRLDGAGAAPAYVSGSKFSTIAPNDTSAVNASSQVVGSVDSGINFVVGDLVFAKVTTNGDNLDSFAWHIVTTAQNITTDIAPTTLRLDGATGGAPTFAASSQVSKITPGAEGAVTAATALSFGDIVMAKTTANAFNNNSYVFHIVTGAAAVNGTALRLDNAPANLTISTTYVTTVTTGVKDSAGNALAANGTVTFTTGSTGGTNTTPPFVQSSQPSPGSQTHPIGAPIKLTFSVDMASSGGGSITDAANIGLFTDVNGAPGIAVTTTKAYDSPSKTVTLTPSSALTAATGYVAKVNITATSATGAVLTAPYFLFFHTPSGAADTTAPTVSGVSPANAATGAALGTVVTAGFSEDMDPSTINANTVTLKKTSNSAAVTGSVTYNPQSRSVSFSPSTALESSSGGGSNGQYTFTIIGGGSDPRVKDLSANALAANYTSAFTTTATADTVKPILTFANADNFSVAVTFSEQMKSGGGPNAADNIANFTLESPVGSSISLGGKTVVYEAGTKTARITGLSLQNGTTETPATFKITVSSVVQDLSSQVMDVTGTPALNTQFGTVANSATSGGLIGPGGGTIDMSMQGMNPSRVMPMSRGAGATSNYHVEFLAGTSIPATGQIVLTFPAGFTLTAADKVAVALSFCNADLNGPATGAPVIDTVVANNDAGTITITTTAAAATGANSFICMDLSGIVNSTVPSSSGYTVTMQTKNTSANNRATLQTITAAPFFLGAAGSRTLTVNVFKDANTNGTNDSGEGINSVTVYLFSPATGGQEATTATVSIAGVATFTNLADGDYMVGLKPTAAIDVAFNSMPQSHKITSDAATHTKNFALSNAAALTISGTINGANTTKVDIFASSPNGFTKKTLTMTGSPVAYSLPVLANSSYNIGVGPAMPETSFTPGAPPPPPPDFSFMPPPSVQVNVAGVSVSNSTVPALAFVLSTADKTITGTVVDSAGTGVSGAGVFCRPVAASTTGSAGGFGTGGQTGTTGAFTLKTVQGVYLCGVFKPGMPPVPEKQITVGASANTPTTLAFVLDAATTLTITGTIKDDSGNAISYAGVSGRKVVSTSNTTAVGGDSGNFVGGPTDANGAYTLYVSAGTWVVEAFAPGFGRLGTKTITITTSSSSGQDFSAQSLSMGTITGTATQATVAVQGVMVRAEDSTGSSGNMTTTGSDGTYSLRVPAGTYSLVCYFPGVGEGTPVTGIAVTANTTTSGKNCTQAAPITITINITDGTNAIANAGVEVRDSNGRGNFTSTSTTSGANAVYTVVVPPGTYTVRAGHPAYGSVGTTTGVNTTRTITYTASAGVLYAVTGTVNGDGSALSGAWVSLNGTPTGQTNTIFLGGQTASNGTFSISVPPGVYKVRADKPGYKSPAESTATVTNATVAVSTIALTTAARTITGTITIDASGVSNAFVDATDGAGGYAVAQTNAAGAYTLNVDNGTWTIRAHSHGYEGGPLPVTVSNNSPSGQNLALTAISGFTIKAERPETVTPASGGFLTNTDIGNFFQMEIPANALGTGSNAATVTTRVNTAMPNPPSGAILSKNAVSIDAVGSDGSPISSLNDEITITIPYTEGDLPAGTSEASLVIGVWNDANQTYDTLSTTVDTTLNTLTATVSHLSDFAPMVASGGTPPATPTGLTLSIQPNSGTIVGLSWTAVANAASYNIYQSTDNSSFPLAGSSTSVGFQATGLTSGTTYYFKISALNSTGDESAASSASSAVPTFIASAAASSGASYSPAASTSSSSSSSSSTPSTTTTTTPTTTATTPTAITGCGNRTTGFSTVTGKSCVGNIVSTAAPATPATPAVPGVSSATPATPATPYNFGTVTLKSGSKGEPVKELQRFLNKVLNLGLVLDGKLGPKTIAVIKQWQKDNGLKADGLIGKKTKALMNAMAK